MLVGYDEVDVCAFGRQGIVGRQSQGSASLPPAIGRANDLGVEEVAVFGFEPYPPGIGFDIDPIAIADFEIGRGLGVNLNQRLANLLAQPRNVAVLFADKLNMTK